MPRILQRDVRIDAERDALLPARKLVLEPPPATTLGRDLEIQATAPRSQRTPAYTKRRAPTKIAARTVS